MPPIPESLTADLAEARTKLDATRAALQKVLGGSDLESIKDAVRRLDQIAAEVARIEGVVEERTVKTN
jgi:hypothetical protein